MQKIKFEKSLIIGKFYPLHLGHCYIIDTALKNSKKLTVIVCQTNKYKIPVETRAQWIKTLYPKVGVKILHHDASLDSGSIRISKKWADLTLNFLGYKPDVVFSSEDYGEAYAKYMGSKHILVDRKRKKFPISGTKIRKNIYKYWRYLPYPVKSHFTKRIVILGAESTGTTTLAKDLAFYFKTSWVPEYGRLYYEGKMFSENNQVWTTEEFSHITQMQNEIEEKMAGCSNKILICDTDSFTTTIWHRRYIGNTSKKLEKFVHTDKHSFYILTSTDIPFIQDGTRDGENIRNWMHRLFIKELGKRHLNYIVVEGSKKERLEKAVKAIEKLPDIYINN